jgi:hypothetical protein
MLGPCFEEHHFGYTVTLSLKLDACGCMCVGKVLQLHCYVLDSLERFFMPFISWGHWFIAMQLWQLQVQEDIQLVNNIRGFYHWTPLFLSHHGLANTFVRHLSNLLCMSHCTDLTLITACQDTTAPRKPFLEGLLACGHNFDAALILNAYTL